MGPIQDLLVGLKRYVGWRALIVLVGLLGLEFGLRQNTHYGDWVVMNKHRIYGWKMLPSQDVWSRWYDIPIHINQWGYRGPEWDAPLQDDDGNYVKDESVFRVAIIGDSMTYGICVPYEDIYSKLLEDKLREDFQRRGIDKKPVVMNFAVQNYVFMQGALIYEHEISNWKPDLLVAPLSPHAILPFGGGEPPIEFPYAQSVLRTASYDYLFKKWINPATKKLSIAELTIGEPGAKTPAWPSPTKDELNLAELEAQFTKTPYKKEFGKYWKDDLERKAQLTKRLEEDGGKLVLFCLPVYFPLLNPKARTPFDIYKYWAEEVQAGPEDANDVYAIDGYPQARKDMANLSLEIQEYLTAKRAAGEPEDFVGAMPTFQYKDDYPLLIEDRGHYSARGHQSVAQGLFDGLQAQGLLPK